MHDLNDPLAGSGVSFWSIMAAVAGSLISFRMLVDVSPLARATSVLSSFLLAFFLGPAIAEQFGFGAKVERAVMLFVAFAGVNLLAGFWVFGQKWREDPKAAIEWLVSILPKLKWGKGDR